MSSQDPYTDPSSTSTSPSYDQGGTRGYDQSGYAQAGQTTGTDTMAILGLVFAFVFWPLGIVFSLIGLNHTKTRPVGGRGLALAGLIVSIVLGVLAILYFVFVGVFLAHHGLSTTSTS